MYTVHNLSLGWFCYEGKQYNLDDIDQANKLLLQLEGNSILTSKCKLVGLYYERNYQFNKQKLPEVFVRKQLDKHWYQLKPTILNIKELCKYLCYNSEEN